MLFGDDGQKHKPSDVWLNSIRMNELRRLEEVWEMPVREDGERSTLLHEPEALWEDERETEA